MFPIVYRPLSPLQQKLTATGQTDHFMFRDGIDQRTNALHNAEELLVCDVITRKK